jgi:hypothetical protein
MRCLWRLSRRSRWRKVGDGCGRQTNHREHRIKADFNQTEVEVMVFSSKPDPPPHPPQHQQQKQDQTRLNQGEKHKNQPIKQPMKTLPTKLNEHQVKHPNLATAKAVIDPRYKAMTCHNCGEPGHFMGICDKPKVCFNCAIPDPT